MAQRTRNTSTRKKAVVVQGGEIGILAGGRFVSYTNFSVEIVHAVTSPKDACISLSGFVYFVKTSDGVGRYVN